MNLQKKKTKLIFVIPLFLILIWVLYVLQRDIRRQGSLKNAWQSWTYTSLFGLKRENVCYKLKYSEVDGDLLLVMRDNSVSEDERSPHAPDGSVMRVKSTDFEPEQYLGECHRFDGFFLLEGTAQWHLTKVID